MNEDLQKNIEIAMQTVWECIGSDIIDAFSQTGNESEIDKELIVEMVLDADRMEFYGELDDTDLKLYKELTINEKFNIANKVFQGY